MSERALLESVADAVAAGEAVDWRDVEQAAADTADADLISQLKIVSAIGAGRRAPESLSSTLSATWSRVVETGVAVVLAIAFCWRNGGCSTREQQGRGLHVDMTQGEWQ